MERAAIVAEVKAGADVDLERLRAAVRVAVARHHEIAVEEIVFVAPHSVRKTSSGKLQRRATREALQTGLLQPLAAVVA